MNYEQNPQSSVQYQQQISPEAFEAIRNANIQSNLALGGIGRAITEVRQQQSSMLAAGSEHANEPTRTIRPNYLEQPATPPETPAFIVKKQEEAKAEAAKIKKSDLEDFLSPEKPEKDPDNLINLNQTQGSFLQSKMMLKQSGRGMGEYAAQVNKESEKFVGRLVSDQVQSKLEDVQLTEAAFDLIASGLYKNGAPDTKVLMRLRKAVGAQNIVTALPHTTNEDGTIDRYGMAAAKERPRYFTDHGVVGPFESPEEDTVNKTLEMLEPEHWFLDDDTRDYYQSILDLDELVYAPPGYKPGAAVYTGDVYTVAEKLGIRDRMNAKKEQKHNASQPKVDAALVELSDKITARYQSRPVSELTYRPSGKAKKELLEKMKEQVRPYLDRDAELRYLKKELDLNDDQSSVQINKIIESKQFNTDPSNVHDGRTERRKFVDESMRRQIEIEQQRDEAVMTAKIRWANEHVRMLKEASASNSDVDSVQIQEIIQARLGMDIEQAQKHYASQRKSL